MLHLPIKMSLQTTSVPRPKFHQSSVPPFFRYMRSVSQSTFYLHFREHIVAQPMCGTIGASVTRYLGFHPDLYKGLTCIMVYVQWYFFISRLFLYQLKEKSVRNLEDWDVSQAMQYEENSKNKIDMYRKCLTKKWQNYKNDN